MSVNGKVAEYIVVNPNIGILYSNENKGTVTTFIPILHPKIYNYESKENWGRECAVK